MSIDYMVWHQSAPISDEAATELYEAVCEGVVDDGEAHPAVNEFCAEFSAAFPDNSLYQSHGYVQIEIAMADARLGEIDAWIWKTAPAKGLTVFDPQTSYVHLPDAAGGFSRPPPGNARLAKWLGPIVALILLSVGLRGAWWIGSDLSQMADSRYWESTGAVIESSGLGLTGSPRVTYAFSVGGETYRGDRIEIPTRKPPNRKAAQRVVSTYPVGSRIVIHYDPDDPARNVIVRPEFHWPSEIVKGSLPLLLLFPGGYLLWRILRKRLADRNAT